MWLAKWRQSTGVIWNRLVPLRLKGHFYRLRGLSKQKYDNLLQNSAASNVSKIDQYAETNEKIEEERKLTLFSETYKY